MKLHRSLAASVALAAIALSLVVGATVAGQDKVIEDQARFLFTRSGINSTIEQYDSTTVATLASYASSAMPCTTTALDTRGLHYRGPHSFWHATFGSIVDTVWAWGFRVQTTDNAVLTGADSVDVTIQGSPDGVNWTSIDTIGVAATVRHDLTGTSGMVTTNLSSTSHGIGTDRINWDKQSLNAIRLIVRRDPNSTAGRRMKLTFLYRPAGGW